VDKTRRVAGAALGKFLWAAILIPILTISWLGFYTIARDVGIPPIFAAGMSAAFDGVALFAARIGLKHRRQGFSGYLARITVLVFAALGAFVQSFHAESHDWIRAHSWIVWATAPVAAVVAYELHLGWVHRKQLIRKGYQHPSAKSGFGPATWLHFPRETLHEYRDVLRARRTYIADTNLKRFELEEAAQPRPESKPPVKPIRPKPEPVSKPEPVERPVQRPERRLHVVAGSSRPRTSNQVIRDWCKANGIELGYNNRIPIAGLRAYQDAVRSGRAS
jgi:hypothetical protein